MPIIYINEYFLFSSLRFAMYWNTAQVGHSGSVKTFWERTAYFNVIHPSGAFESIGYKIDFKILESS